MANILILIVGAGSNLAESFSSVFDSSKREFVTMSRERPKWQNKGRWINTNYNLSDESIEKLKSIEAPECVIWLASPISRELFVSMPEDAILETLNSGIAYQALLVKTLLPNMISNRYGRFVFTGSVGASLGDIGTTLYSITKSAQSGLSRGIAIEYGRFGITSNVIKLGLMKHGLSSTLPEERLKEFKLRTTSSNYINPMDFWNLVKLLFDSGGINGAELNLDGGFR